MTLDQIHLFLDAALRRERRQSAERLRLDAIAHSQSEKLINAEIQKLMR